MVYMLIQLQQHVLNKLRQKTKKVWDSKTTVTHQPLSRLMSNRWYHDSDAFVKHTIVSTTSKIVPRTLLYYTAS